MICIFRSCHLDLLQATCCLYAWQTTYSRSGWGILLEVHREDWELWDRAGDRNVQVQVCNWNSVRRIRSSVHVHINVCFVSTSHPSFAAVRRLLLWAMCINHKQACIKVSVPFSNYFSTSGYFRIGFRMYFLMYYLQRITPKALDGVVFSHTYVRLFRKLENCMMKCNCDIFWHFSFTIKRPRSVQQTKPPICILLYYTNCLYFI